MQHFSQRALSVNVHLLRLYLESAQPSLCIVYSKCTKHTNPYTIHDIPPIFSIDQLWHYSIICLPSLIPTKKKLGLHV